ncbi:MAG: Peptidase M50 [candidate division WWE3 bacterium GW2011_GWC1_41_7]|uniref:Peptidase M50 n=2 Tax=Katanobacteria TaxID=422282 RepID=A0A0G0ZFT4_UNCKA|nr:MAG: Peptidase M50 [candidate division WWE3 bacterium GW2011_GWC1_41_7]
MYNNPMTPIQLLTQNPAAFVLLAISLIICISIHEFAHAYSSFKLGDPTAKSLGRVTLNPLAHLDPVGTLLLLIAGFGWGKPVPFDPSYLKNPKRDAALISLAGPMSNFLLAIVLTIILKAFGSLGALNTLVFMVIYFNLILGFFNLIPIHPLDGFKVVNGLLPDNLSVQWIQMAPYGIFILLFLILTNTTSRLLGSFIGIALNILGLN